MITLISTTLNGQSNDSRYESVTYYPSISNNVSFVKNVGWQIYAVKATNTELTVTFIVDDRSSSRNTREILAFSRLMYVGDYNSEIYDIVKEGWRSYGGSASRYWSEFYNEEGSVIPWVIRCQKPTLAFGLQAKYWTSFGNHFTISDASSNSQYVFEVVFPPIARGIETITIADYFTGVRFENISIDNPYEEAIPSGYTSQSELIGAWNELGIDNYEGIYDYVGHDYSLAVVELDETSYMLVYLSGGSDPWVCGDVKGVLHKTATPGLFKVDWILEDMSFKKGLYGTIETGSMKIIGFEEELFFVKTYPTYDGNKKSSSESRSGTGFALNSDGYIVTNYHVIEGGSEINIRGVNGNFSKSYPAKVIMTDLKNDLAICKIENVKIERPVYSFSFSTESVASECFTLGYPMKQILGDEVKFTDGRISSKSGFQGDVGSYQISVPVQPGNSGGPLFNSKGDIIGIVSAKITDAENVSYAIKSNQLLNLIETHTNPLVIPKDNLLKNNSLSEKIKRIRDFVYIIEVH